MPARLAAVISGSPGATGISIPAGSTRTTVPAHLSAPSAGKIAVDRFMIMPDPRLLVTRDLQDAGAAGLHPVLDELEIVAVLLQDRADISQFGDVAHRLTDQIGREHV